jgi:hypothetical protein
MKCSCGKEKAADYHLACPSCWAFVPKPLQDRVWKLYREARGSDNHVEAVRECYEHIRAGRNTPKKPGFAKPWKQVFTLRRRTGLPRRQDPDRHRHLLGQRPAARRRNQVPRRGSSMTAAHLRKSICLQTERTLTALLRRKQPATQARKPAPSRRR